MGHNRIVPRRVIKAVQMTDAWRNHLDDLSKRSPIDPAHFFEFKSTLSYGPSDLEIEDRKVEEQIVERTQMPAPQPVPEQIIPVTVAPASPEPVAAVHTQGDPAQEEQQVRFTPAAVAPSASPMPRRRMEFGLPLPAIIAAAQPDPQRPIPMYDKGAPLIVEGKRPRRSNYKVFSACTSRADDTKLDAGAVQYDRDTNMFVYMGAHDDTWDFTVMQITLEAALKTKYKEQVEATTVKECLNIINFKTFKYLRSKEHAEKTTHPGVLPCSMVVKDKRDSKGELLLWKSRFCTGGHRTDPTTYQPFDKTSPTASMDAVHMVLIFAQHMRMNIEVCDVPSAKRKEALDED
jgi:hypothetical protein